MKPGAAGQGDRRAGDSPRCPLTSSRQDIPAVRDSDLLQEKIVESVSHYAQDYQILKPTARGRAMVSLFSPF